MAGNELGIINNAFPISVAVFTANPASGATVDLAFNQGGAGYVVPEGYVAYPVALHAESNANIATGGSAVLKVIDDGTEIDEPVVTLVRDTQAASDVARIGAHPIAAGSVVSVSVTTGASNAATDDYDAVFTLVLVPA